MGTRKVIVAFNDLASAEALCRHLQAKGYEASPAQDAFSLGQLLHGGAPDLIVLDFKLAGGDGPTVVDRLRGNTRTLEVPVILLVEGDAEEARALFAHPEKLYFLKSPAAPAMLNTMIHQLLGPAEKPSPPARKDDPDDGPTVLDLDA